MSFWEKGYKALFISSFYTNPHMHSSGDTLDKVHRRFLMKGAQALVRMMVLLSNE